LAGERPGSAAPWSAPPPRRVAGRRERGRDHRHRPRRHRRRAGAIAARFSNFSPSWLLVAIAGQLAAVGGCAVSYRTLLAFDGRPRLSPIVTLRLVVAGFGGFATGGGLVLDRRALAATREARCRATIRVLGLGALEYAVIVARRAWRRSRCFHPPIRATPTIGR
jgi:hypothetical protein